MLKVSFFLILLSFGLHTRGKVSISTAKDSVRILLSNGQPERAIYKLNHIFMSHLVKGERDSGLKYMKLTDSLLKENNTDTNGRNLFLIHKAGFYHSENKNDSALETLFAALTHLKKHKNSFLEKKTYNKIGIVQCAMGHFLDAKKSFNYALALHNYQFPDLELVKIYEGLTLLNMEIANYKETLRYADSAINVVKSIPNINNYQHYKVTYLLKSEAHLELKQYHKTLKCLSFLEQSEKEQAEMWGMIMMDKMVCYSFMDSVKQTLTYLDKCKKVLHAGAFPSWQIPSSYINMAQAYLNIDSTENALVYASKSLDLKEDIINKGEVARLHLILSNIHEQLGNTHLELKHRKIHDSLYKESFKPNELLLIGGQDYMKSIEALRRANESTQHKLKFAQHKTKILIVIVSIILCFTIFLLVNTIRQKRKSQELFDQLISISTPKTIKLPLKEEKTRSSTVPKEVLLRISNYLEEAITDQLYTSSDFTSNTVAAASKTNKTYISKAMPLLYGSSFNEWLNGQRIEYTIDQLKKSEKYRNYTIEHISSLSGYSNRRTFQRAFKAHTGITAWFFIQGLKKAS